MRYGKRFRLTPPWPPGLESIQKALLGPARYRRGFESSSPPTAPYDDTLLIALAIQTYLNGNNSGFRLEAPGLRLHCQLETDLSPRELDALMIISNDTPPALDDHTFIRLMASGIITEAHLDGGDIRHRSCICRKARNVPGLMWNAAFNTAVQLLHKRQAAP